MWNLYIKNSFFLVEYPSNVANGLRDAMNLKKHLMKLQLYFGGTLHIFSARMAKMPIQTFSGNGYTLWIILQDVWPHEGEYSCSWDIPGHSVAKQL